MNLGLDISLMATTDLRSYELVMRPRHTYVTCHTDVAKVTDRHASYRRQHLRYKNGIIVTFILNIVRKAQPRGDVYHTATMMTIFISFTICHIYILNFPKCYTILPMM